MNFDNKTREELINELQKLQDENNSLKASIEKYNNKHIKTEEILIKTNSELKELFDNAPVGYHEIDVEGCIVRINQTELNMLGYTESELIGRYIWTLNVEEEISKQAVIAKLSGTLLPSETFEREYKCKDGTTVHVLIKDNIIKDKNDVIIGIRSTIQNITERKKAEIKLIESEERYKRITQGITDYLYTVRVSEGRVIETIHNEACIVVTGYSPQELLSDPFLWINMVVPEERDWVAERFRKITEGNDLPPFEHRIICKNGSVRWISNSAIPKYDSNGQLISYDGVITDITQRKIIEQALSETKANLSAIIENTLDSIWAFNTNFEIIYVNEVFKKAFFERFNIHLEIGMSFSNILKNMPEELLQYWKSLFNRALNNEHSVFEEKIEIENKVLYFEISMNPIVSEGKVIGASFFSRDITDRKNAEHDIQRINEELIKLNADKDRFISILAHDLRNPFNSVLGFLDLLIENIREYDIDKIDYQLNIINDSARMVYNLLEDILLWVRSQRGLIPFEPKELNFIAICNDVVNLLKPNASAKNININYFTAEKISVFADIDMLKTILRNLISNAIKYTHIKGRISIYAEKNQSIVTISVIDTGVGIEPELKEKLFEISQAHSTFGTEREAGTGLGLLLCKEFVAKHGGDIWVESELGKGSVFKFTLKAIG